MLFQTVDTVHVVKTYEILVKQQKATSIATAAIAAAVHAAKQ